MGCRVGCAGPGALAPGDLLPPPVPPQRVSADVTTLCALVSEVTNVQPGVQIRSWAARITHFQVRPHAHTTPVPRWPGISSLNPPTT